MTREEFEQLVSEEFPNAIPEKFRSRIKNVAFLIEDEPSQAVRLEEKLAPDQTLLGLYHGLPNTARGDIYGVGTTLPDTITLYQYPIEWEAETLTDELIAKEGREWGQGPERSIAGRKYEQVFESMARKVIRETIWHEIGHYFGMDEHAVRKREAERQQDIL